MAFARRGRRIVELFPSTHFQETAYEVQNFTPHSAKVVAQWLLKKFEEDMYDCLLDVSEPAIGGNILNGLGVLSGR